MSTLTRRGLLGRGSVTGAAVLLGTGALTTDRANARPKLPENAFTLGVASGDPEPDGVVLWTRLAPDPYAPDGLGGMAPEKVRVRYEIAEDDRFRRIVRRGTAVASPELAHTVHAEVHGSSRRASTSTASRRAARSAPSAARRPRPSRARPWTR